VTLTAPTVSSSNPLYNYLVAQPEVEQASQLGVTDTANPQDTELILVQYASFTLNPSFPGNPATLFSVPYTTSSNFTGTTSIDIVGNPNAQDPDFPTLVPTSLILTAQVNTAPSITAPSNVAVNQNATLAFTGPDAISVTDAGGTAEQMTLLVNEGTLTLGTTTSLAVTGNGTSSLTLSGTLASLNSDLATLSYTPTAGYNGPDTLSLSDKDTSDSLTVTDSVSITVNPLAPTITAPATASVNENAALAFTAGNAISVTDPSGTAEQLTLTVSHGTLSLGTTTGLTVTGNGSASLVLSGTLASLNSDLATLSYAPTSGYNGPDTLSLSDKDTTDSLTGSARVSITVNPLAPLITAPASVSVNENASLAFTAGNAISVTDPNGTAEQFTLTVSHGTLSLGTTTGLTVTGNGSASLVLSGTLASLNSDLASLVYTPTSGYNGSDTLSLSDKDTSDSLTGSASVSITVNPVGQALNVTAPATASVSENTSLVFSSSNGSPITVADTNANSHVEQLTLVAAHGKVILASTKGLTVTSGSNDSASMTVKGTLANLNADLNGLKFTPTTGYFGSASLTVSYKDLGNSQTAPATVAITVTVPASQPTVKIETFLPVGVPGEPIPLLLLVSDTNAAAQSATFNCIISFGDGTTRSVTSKSPLLVDHIYTHPGTFTVSVTATDEYGHTSTVATATIKILPVFLGTDPFNPNKTALFVGATTGNDTVSFAASGRNGIAVTVDGVNEGVYSTTGPLIVFGQG